jgi:serine/threonine protein kinase
MPSENLRTLGRYTLKETIGRGAIGTVYLGIDAALARPVVIKTLRISETPDASHSDLARRFGLEARAVARLRHPGIVTIYDVGQQDNVAFIVMEYMEGGSLASRLRALGKLTGPEVCAVVTAVAQALDYAHSQGFVHRDVKPGNILFDSDEHAKIADFGIVKSSTVEVTHPGTFMGTPAYISPEQITGRGGATADQWSLAAVAYEALAGHRLVKAEDISEAIYLILNIDLLPHRELPPAVDAVLRKALTRDPSERFKTCAEFASSLCAALEHEQTLISSEQLAAPTNGLATGNVPAVSPSMEAAPDLPVPAAEVPPTVLTPVTTELSPGATESTLTRLAERQLPPGVTATQIFPATGFFSSSTDRYAEIKGSLQFFRDGLQRDYEELSAQAKLTYKLWVACVALGFLVLVLGVGLMFANRIAQGAITAASTLLIYFIQRVFQQREDHYRAAATQKHSNLEYGNQWLLVIQSIDAMEDSRERALRQARLVDALTDRLKKSRASSRSAADSGGTRGKNQEP